ncbi:ABC-type transport auxiliary lipoprotein family protein [Methylocystis sp. B8]|uniref:ABC-type transport auxiliary lipoprotein family protein n=1 Tax=Methylocystis sp. B8 TaxID=544938 RepID=UPI0010FEE65E|nr:ABC-type transport auxiliary lipoprotein family protein [Methylocystis sp. B8]TLG75577.1 ABC transporter protein [Methylocystis sp. B8]
MKLKASMATRRKAARMAAIALLALVVGACAQATRETFDLTSDMAGLRGIALRGGPPVFVSEPAAVAPTSSDRIVVRAADDSVAVLPGVQWSEPLPLLFQRRLIESLQRCGLSASAGMGAQTRLQTDLRRFEIDIARDLAVIEVSVELIDVNNGRARAARIFIEETPAPDHIGAQAARALSDAAAQVALRIGQWTRARL